MSLETELKPETTNHDQSTIQGNTLDDAQSPPNHEQSTIQGNALDDTQNPPNQKDILLLERIKLDVKPEEKTILSFSDDRSDYSEKTERTQKFDIIEEGESSSTLSFYVETNLDDEKVEKSYSLKSVYSIKSWPSDAYLYIDSNVYPQISLQSEYGKELILEEERSLLMPQKKNSRLQLISSTMTSENSDIFSVSDKFNEAKKKNEELIKIDQKLEQSVIDDTQISFEKPLSQRIKEQRCIKRKKQIYKKKEKAKKHICKSRPIEIESFYLKDIVGINLPIGREFLNQICFIETLYVSQEILSEEEKKAKRLKAHKKEIVYKPQIVESNETIEVGAFRLSIEFDCNKFITYCTSQFSCENSVGGSKLLATTKENLKLIEEKKTEWHINLQNKIEKSLHIVNERNKYVALRTFKENNKLEKNRADFELVHLGDLLLDGSLFVLMRYLILQKYEGKVEMWSMNISGNLCKCVLSVGKRRIFYIQNKPHQTIEIKKVLLFNDLQSVISKTYFLPTGHILRHKWKESKISLHLNPYTLIPPPEWCINLKGDWKNDIILFSKYLDNKAKSKSEIETYITDNPRVKTMLKDFLLATIMRRPSDVLNFTIDYFLGVCGDNGIY